MGSASNLDAPKGSVPIKRSKNTDVQCMLSEAVRRAVDRIMVADLDDTRWPSVQKQKKEDYKAVFQSKADHPRTEHTDIFCFRDLDLMTLTWEFCLDILKTHLYAIGACLCG